jgi:hypothetical protein
MVGLGFKYHSSMVYRGKVRDNVVVLEPGTRLPEGAAVKIEIVEEPRIDQDPLLAMTGLAVETGIEDLATNIDHYLYGHPKASDVT